LNRLIAGLSQHQLRVRPTDQKWSIIEILAHLAEDELATAWRYRQMLEHNGGPLSGFDQELWARLGTYTAWDAGEALELFRLLRASNLRLLTSLSPEQWDHSGEHAERGKLSVADLARHMAAHDINHIQQIESLLPPPSQGDVQARREPQAEAFVEQAAQQPMCLTLKETAELLRRTPVVLRELVLALPSRAVEYHPGDEKWCIKQIVGHLTEEDRRDFVGRIELMLRQQEPQLNLNDQVEVAQTRHDCDKDIRQLLDEFATVRSASATFVEQLSPADLARTGVHPKIGVVCVRELLHEWLYHDLNHVKQIEQNTQRLLWNQLGNFKAFYAG
jgi:uncharacterized damage-inducible protein DinB